MICFISSTITTMAITIVIMFTITVNISIISIMNYSDIISIINSSITSIPRRGYGTLPW